MSGTNKRKGSAYWSEQLGLQSASGMSIAAYCDQAGVNRHNFMYWRAKLRSDQVSEQPGFVAIGPVGHPAVGRVVVRGRWGVEVEVPHDYPLSGLEGIIRSLSC